MDTTNPFPAAAPDFSDPLGLLRACHENIFRHCRMLERLTEHLTANGADRAACETAEKIHRYFSTAARLHHADEEEDLFPMLAGRSQEMADYTQCLRQEHIELDTLWGELGPLLGQPLSIVTADDFSARAKRFADANHSHADKENERLLDTALRTLGNDELKRLGRGMAERRGVTLPASL